MKTIALLFATVLSVAAHAQVTTITVNNTTSCNMTVYLYSQSGCTFWFTQICAPPGSTVVAGNGNAAYNWDWAEAATECGGLQCANYAKAGWAGNCPGLPTTSVGSSSRPCSCPSAATFTLDCATAGVVNLF